MVNNISKIRRVNVKIYMDMRMRHIKQNETKYKAQNIKKNSPS